MAAMNHSPTFQSQLATLGGYKNLVFGGLVPSKVIFSTDFPDPEDDEEEDEFDDLLSLLL
jgi:hypothetical protein